MNPALAAVAAITIAGGVIAVSSRDVRTIVLGIFLVLLAAPLIADPWPDPLATLARIAASLLAVRFLAIGLRGEDATRGTRIGWPAEGLLAAAGAVVGFGSHGLGAAGLGPAEAQAAGFALLVLAATPLITGRDVLRLGIGSLLLLGWSMGVRRPPWMLVRIGIGGLQPTRRARRGRRHGDRPTQGDHEQRLDQLLGLAGRRDQPGPDQRGRDE